MVTQGQILRRIGFSLNHGKPTLRHERRGRSTCNSNYLGRADGTGSGSRGPLCSGHEQSRGNRTIPHDQRHGRSRARNRRTCDVRIMHGHSGSHHGQHRLGNDCSVSRPSRPRNGSSCENCQLDNHRPVDCHNSGLSRDLRDFRWRSSQRRVLIFDSTLAPSITPASLRQLCVRGGREALVGGGFW